MLARAVFFLFLFCVSGVCSVVFDCFWLSVPVQLIAWKDSSRNDLLCVEWDVKPYALTHSLTLCLLQASTVKGLPDTERLKAAKFTGLRWDIDPVVIEYFRYLLNDVVGSAGRKNSASHQAQLNRSLSSSSNRSTALKSTSALLTTDRRLSDRSWRCIVSLQARHHDRLLTQKPNSTADSDFIVRMLFKDSY